MRSARTILRPIGVCCVLLAASSAALAEDVSKKWRIGLGVGGYNAQDEVESAAANELFLLEPCVRTLTCPPGTEIVQKLFRDPRDDSSVFGSFDINPATLGTLSVQYAASTMFVIEGSIGYQKGDVGDVEVSASFPGNAPEIDEVAFNFDTVRVKAGELERVPIQLTALARLRPRAALNPYFGAGIGYSVIGFNVDSALDALSQNIDASTASQLRLTDARIGGGAIVDDNLPSKDLSGIVVEANDTFEWHLAAGLELSVKRKWSVFLDLRWVDASRALRLGVNNADELGVSVPNFIGYADTGLATKVYGPVAIGSCSAPTAEGFDESTLCTDEGLVDVGRVAWVPEKEAPINTDCTNPNEFASCEIDFVFEPDGRLDPGNYYVKGGQVDYDGFALQVGFRYTFK